MLTSIFFSGYTFLIGSADTPPLHLTRPHGQESPCHSMCRRRQEAQQTGKTPWPPDWGPGDGSHFAEFPELPKSRAQLVPPAKARHIRDASNGAAVRPRQPARMEGPQLETGNELLLQNANDISSADLDAMIFKQRPYERQTRF